MRDRIYNFLRCAAFLLRARLWIIFWSSWLVEKSIKLCEKHITRYLILTEWKKRKKIQNPVCIVESDTTRSKNDFSLNCRILVSSKKTLKRRKTKIYPKNNAARWERNSLFLYSIIAHSLTHSTYIYILAIFLRF